MMRHLLPVLLLTACVQPLHPHPVQSNGALAPGETRSVELWMLEFNVDGYEQSISLDTLNSLPQSVLDDIWLLDMPLLGLVDNSLAQLRDLPIDEALLLPLPAQNMRTLLRTTPDNAVLEGTSLEELLSLSVTLGIPPANPLAELFDVGVTDPVLPLESATIALIEGLIATHPASQTRMGAVDAEHPDGVYVVAENSLPITVGDVVSNFEDLAERFAPAETEWGTHPGFIDEAIGFSVVDDEFELLVKVQINALPYRGVDLTNASNATVNSTGAQIDDMFQTEDPNWLRTVGMVEEPFISDLTIHIVENDEFMYAGDVRDPAPLGNGAAWDLPPWEIEYLIAAMSYDAAANWTPKEIAYQLGTGTTIFTSVLDASGWVTFETFNNAGSPPGPQYIWDHVLEMAQIRLHDGGLEEGEGGVAFTLHDVSVGMTATEISDIMATNMAANPAALRELAKAITENSVGEADFYYYRPAPNTAESEAGDWLYFIDEVDLPLILEGEEGRTYTYEKPGFYSDKALTQKQSSTDLVHGDDLHEKVRVQSGDVLYMADDAGVVFELAVQEKPSLHRVLVDVTRL